MSIELLAPLMIGGAGMSRMLVVSIELAVRGVMLLVLSVVLLVRLTLRMVLSEHVVLHFCWCLQDGLCLTVLATLAWQFRCLGMARYVGVSRALHFARR